MAPHLFLGFTFRTKLFHLTKMTTITAAAILARTYELIAVVIRDLNEVELATAEALGEGCFLGILEA